MGAAGRGPAGAPPENALGAPGGHPAGGADAPDPGGRPVLHRPPERHGVRGEITHGYNKLLADDRDRPRAGGAGQRRDLLVHEKGGHQAHRKLSDV